MKIEDKIVNVLNKIRPYLQNDGGNVESPLKTIGESKKTGTTVTFLPDATIFETLDYELDTLALRLREMAFLNKGLKLTIEDLRVEEPIKQEFHYEGGDYPDYVLEKLPALDRIMTAEDVHSLLDTIIVKTQGFICGNISEGDSAPLEHFRALLSLYEGVTKEALRENLVYFLKAIMPVCDAYGIDMCIHPDDPPMPVFGLPRIVCNADDIRYILAAVDNPHNGLTFCAGSLSAGSHNDVEAMAREFASRSRFVHLRTCTLLQGGDFVEAPHVDGRVNLVELLRIFGREDPSLPMRVDHGRDMLSDSVSGYNPGYGFYGRMFALAQVEGMMCALSSLEGSSN